MTAGTILLAMSPGKTIYHQAAAVPFKREKKGVRVLLITSRKTGRWIIPKGLIEPGDTALFTAMKESTEEAGISGEIVPTVISRYSYPKWEGRCEVVVYPLKVSALLPHYEEENERKRRWFSLEDAIRAVDREELKDALRAFKQYHGQPE